MMPFFSMLVGAVASLTGEVSCGSGCAAPLPVERLIDDYDRLAGQRVAVEGFLVFIERRAYLLSGAPRGDAAGNELKPPDASRFWCTSAGRFAPLEITSISAEDRSRLTSSIYGSPHEETLMGQRVIVEGVLRRNPAGEMQMLLPLTSTVFGPLQEARLVSAHDTVCAGDEPVDR
jgi:hypothetical protein